MRVTTFECGDQHGVPLILAQSETSLRVKLRDPDDDSCFQGFGKKASLKIQVSPLHGRVVVVSHWPSPILGQLQDRRDFTMQRTCGRTERGVMRYKTRLEIVRLVAQVFQAMMTVSQAPLTPASLLKHRSVADAPKSPMEFSCGRCRVRRRQDRKYMPPVLDSHLPGHRGSSLRVHRCLGWLLVSRTFAFSVALDFAAGRHSGRDGHT